MSQGVSLLSVKALTSVQMLFAAPMHKSLPDIRAPTEATQLKACLSSCPLYRICRIIPPSAVTRGSLPGVSGWPGRCGKAETQLGTPGVENRTDKSKRTEDLMPFVELRCRMGKRSPACAVHLPGENRPNAWRELGAGTG